ncbi:hypothetical protein DJ568_02555 [Mucilaginibacter hurinus]|uniref:IPT/TIG domain-containing protein n=1 Tax=Mucilaginibacter hurinus TaxID=2201324 RepID=A0A367GUK6_9SPHI|nr:hypothetical protein [Mucilaginibacter hurinus]RCH56755.1 hypothetical protein DJ568_02555 [Mucilaginibacter hurinus]
MNFFKKLACFSLIALAGCKKDQTPLISGPSDNVLPQVNATDFTFSPSAGLNFTAVTFTGSFSTAPGATIVKFNGKPGLINSITATKIVATVPGDATTGKVSVTVNGSTATSITDFKVLSLVKERAFDTNFYISNLSFDRSGNGVAYAISGYQEVKKISPNWAINTVYKAPVPIENPFEYHYDIRGIDNDGSGNVYITRDRYEGYQEIIYPEGWANWNYRLTNSAVYKINPNGQLNKLLGDGTGKNFEGLSDLMVDIKGQRLMLLENLYPTKKVLRANRAGIVQTLDVPVPKHSLLKDYNDNYYVINSSGPDQGKLFKVSPNGVATYISGTNGPVTKEGAANVAVIAQPQGLIVDNTQNILLLNRGDAFRVVNAAGYVGKLSTAMPATESNNAMHYNQFTSKIYILSNSSNKGIVYQYAIK